MTSTAINTQGTQIQVATGTGSAQTISGVTVGNPTVLTATAHGFSNGDRVAIAALSGANASVLNGNTYTVQFKTTNTFAINVDTTGDTITAGSGTATPQTYTAVGNSRTFTGLDGAPAEIDVTNLASTAKEIRLGLVDYGQLTFECDHDNGDGGQAALLSHYVAGSSASYKIVLPAGTTPTASFTAFVKKFALTGGIDAVARRNVDLRISGPVTWA
jgi:hypothetical protein